MVREINFVSHSIGAASTEGYIDKFMVDPVLKELLKKGEIVHFSACDGNAIDIYYADQLNRCQINYLGDKTLKYADANAVAATGGYAINGINKKAVVITDFNNYPNDPNQVPILTPRLLDAVGGNTSLRNQIANSYRRLLAEISPDGTIIYKELDASANVLNVFNP